MYIYPTAESAPKPLYNSDLGLTLQPPSPSPPSVGIDTPDKIPTATKSHVHTGAGADNVDNVNNVETDPQISASTPTNEEKGIHKPLRARLGSGLSAVLEQAALKEASHPTVSAASDANASTRQDASVAETENIDIENIETNENEDKSNNSNNGDAAPAPATNAAESIVNLHVAMSALANSASIADGSRTFTHSISRHSLKMVRL